MNFRNLLVILLVFLMVTPLWSEEYIVFLKNNNFKNVEKLSPDLSNRGEILQSMEETNRANIDNFLSKNLTRGTKVISKLWSVNGFVIDSENSDIYKNSPEVEKVIKNYEIYPEEAVKSEDAIPDSSEPYTYGLKNLNIPDVWKKYDDRGKNVLVGIIDSGIDGKHPEFKNRIKIYKDFVGDTTINNMKDDIGHGSHVAGTIGGSNMSGTAIGVAPECDLIIARALSRSKVSRVANLLNAMEWMIDPDGNPNTNDFPRVVNSSWRSGGGDQTPYYKMMETWLKVGIIPAFSAGNSGPYSSTITPPKEYPGSFASAAADKNREIARFSSRGPGKYKGTKTRKPDWTTPGVDVLSVKVGGGYTKKSGTSMASPHTTGIIALVLSANPKLSVQNVREILENSAVDAGDTGYDYTYGYGLLDGYRAVTLAKTSSYIRGKVTFNGKGVSGAKIIIRENNREIVTNEDGTYNSLVIPGRYTLLVSYFGYATIKKEINVEGSTTQELNFEFKKGNKITISGKVIERGTNFGVKAHIEVSGHPDYSTDSDAAGNYSLEIFEGPYSLIVTSKKFETKITDERDFLENTQFDIEIEHHPQVLIVDKDRDGKYIKYYMSALKANKITAKVHSIAEDGPITLDELFLYNRVIWTTGLQSSVALTTDETNKLKSYLQSGGSLLLTGQDIAFSIRYKTELKSLFRVQCVSDVAKTKEIFERVRKVASLVGGDGANNQHYPDVLKPVNGSSILYYYGQGDSHSKEIAGIKYDKEYKLIFLGFGFEGVNSKVSRKRMMKTIMNFLDLKLDEKLSRIDKIKKFYENNKLNSNILNEYVDKLAYGLNRYSKEDLKSIPESYLNEYKSLKESLFSLLNN